MTAPISPAEQIKKKNMRIFLLFVGAVLLLVGGGIAASIIRSNAIKAPYYEKRAELIESGTEVTALSNSKYVHSRYRADKARLSHAKYFAVYEYKTPDGVEHTIQGLIGYNVPSDIKYDKKAIVRYSGSGESFKDVIVSEQYHFTDADPIFKEV